MIRFLALGLLAATRAWAAAPVAFHFEPNRGQAGPEVRYLASVRNATIALTDTGLVADSPASRVALVFEGASRASRWEAADAAPGGTSYLIGSDPHRWLRDIPHYNRVKRRNLYSGIDIVAYGAEGRLEYDFVVSSGADPDRIRLRFEGDAHLEVTEAGDLRIQAAHGELLQKRPAIYQSMPGGTRRPIRGRYRLLGGGRVAFAVAAFDRSRPLTIDPVIESATLLGGSGDDRVVLADPTLFVVGSTVSPDFPGAPVGPHRATDVFIYSPLGQSTVIIGGSGDEVVTCASGVAGLSPAVLIGGYTNSRDLPVLSNYSGVTVPQAQYGGGDYDGFIIFFTQNAPALVTYIGGSGDDRVLAADYGAGQFVAMGVAGSTTSTDFPLQNAWQSTPGGATDGFVTLVNVIGPNVPVFQVSSYLGGSGDERALAISVNSTGDFSTVDFYVAGETGSSDWTLPGVSWTGSR
jgi:hypothetical protein